MSFEDKENMQMNDVQQAVVREFGFGDRDGQEGARRAGETHGHEGAQKAGEAHGHEGAQKAGEAHGHEGAQAGETGRARRPRRKKPAAAAQEGAEGAAVKPAEGRKPSGRKAGGRKTESRPEGEGSKEAAAQGRTASGSRRSSGGRRGRGAESHGAENHGAEGRRGGEGRGTESRRATVSRRGPSVRSAGRRSAKSSIADLPVIQAAAAQEAREARAAAAAAAETKPAVKKQRNTRKDGQGRLKIIPLGGLEQIGMNITAFEYGDSIIVVDCGLAFPSDDMLGIDLVIPDVTYLKQNIDKVKAFVITHGHEDHIGALPYILKDVNVPVYSTKLTIALIEHKLEEHNLLKTTKRKVVKHGQTITLGDFRVEFIKTNHSIQDASALAIYSPVGTVIHTGDFKIDYTPIFGDPIDLQRFAELGKKGVLALLADSTNATRPGFTMSERTVGKTFDTIFADHPTKRIIVATFASNVDRVQQIVNTAYKYGRKVVVEGRSMVTVIEIASRLGYINIPEGTLIDIENLKNYPPESTVLITTGSQGESMAALSRMAASIHKKVSIMPGDVVVLSSTPIPGNEKAVANVVNELSMKGAEVICQDTHVSGHACQEDLKLIYSLVHPRFAIPVHGEYRHRTAQKELAEFMGVPKERTVLISSGDVLAIDEDGCDVIDHVPCGGIFVDGLGVGDVGNIVLRDRQNLSQNGIIVVVMSLDRRSNRVLAGPDIVSRGFVYVRESEDLLEEAHSVVASAVEDCMGRGVGDWSKIKNVIKDSLSDFLWKRMKRDPVILPIIMEV